MKCDTCAETPKKPPRISAIGKPILPRGWRRFLGKIWCGKCFHAAYRIRAVTIPIAWPKDGEARKTLAEAIRVSFLQSTGVSNFAAGYIYSHDVTRTPGMEKIPKYEVASPYHEAREVFPDMPSRSLSCVLDQVQKKYMRRRYQARWTYEASCPSHRQGQPFPISAQSWSLSRDTSDQLYAAHGGRLVFSARLNGAMHHIAPAMAGRGVAAKLAQVEMIERGEALGVEAQILRRRETAGNGDKAAWSRANGGGQRVNWRIMLKIVGWFKRDANRETAGTLRVSTCGNNLLRAAMPADDKLWLFNADNLVRFQRGHARRLQRLSDDRKAETRAPRRHSLGIQGFTDRLCHKHADRMKTGIDTAAAFLVKYAARRRAAEIQYDDSDRSYIESFPWFRLKEAIKQNCSKYGIGFRARSDSDEARVGVADDANS